MAKNDINFQWPTDIKAGDQIIVPITGKDGDSHDTPFTVSKTWHDDKGNLIMVSGFMKVINE